MTIKGGVFHMDKEMFDDISNLMLADYQGKRFQLANALAVELHELCLNIIGNDYKIEGEFKKQFLDIVNMSNEIMNIGYESIINDTYNKNIH